ncbi:MAG: hypothetical protein ACRCTX_26570 [Afipia sp.]
MASEVDICNLALARLGEDATLASIDPPEGSAHADHCARFYPIARDALLEMRTWSFATTRVTLAALTIDTWEWQYAYARPTNCVRALAVLPKTAISTDVTQPFAQGFADSGSVILTNQEDATLRYTARVTDTTHFPPLFVDALSILLASHLAGPILKGSAGQNESKAQMQVFMAFLGMSSTSDANQQHAQPAHVAPWMAAR